MPRTTSPSLALEASMPKRKRKSELGYAVLAVAFLGAEAAVGFLAFRGWATLTILNTTWFVAPVLVGCCIGLLWGRDVRHKLLAPAVLLMIVLGGVVGGRAGAQINGIMSVLNGVMAYWLATLLTLFAATLTGDQMRGFVRTNRR